MNRLTPAVLLTLVPALARADDLTEVVTPIAIVGTIFGFSALMIGIVASVFSAVIVSRVIIELLIERGKHVSFG